MARHEESPPGADVESLFLWHGGPFARGLERLDLARGGRLRTARLGLLLAIVTWLPLLLLAAIEGVAWGGVKVPLLADFLPYGQLFVAVPVLAVGDAVVGRRLGRAMAELRRSDVLAPEDTPELDDLLTRAAAGWRGRWVNRVILLLTLLATGLSFWGVKEWLTGGWQFVGDRVTLAGWWYLAVSTSVLRFLTLRWVWRLFLWAWLLWRVARLRLRPRPTHPDRAGGLAFLGTTQASFGLLVFALSVQLACLVADAVHHQGADLMAYQGHVVAFVLAVVGLLVLPLVPFSPRLLQARAEGLVFLSGSAYEGATRLEKELEGDASKVFSSPDISGLSDFGALYENARAMKPVPLDPRHLVVMVLSALLPFLPLIFLVIPAREVFQALRELVL